MASLQMLRHLCCTLSFSTLIGCPYISAHTLEIQLCKVDEDGDGDPKNICTADGVIAGSSDCNDQDASIFHGAPEVAYDKIDQDCDGEHYDLVDTDYDGYPGITKSDFDALPGDAVWPPTVMSATEDYDCDDTVKNIHVGAPDPWYDGVDSNCDEKDDFDADGDGFASDNYIEEYSAYGGQLDATDCDDHDYDTNITIANDDLYDGIDSDCDAQNDFDADGDTYIATVEEAIAGGYLPNGITSEQWDGLFNEFIARYGYDHIVQHVEYDCDDLEITTNPNAAEVWYDGVDGDCAEDDDYDQDKDGFASSFNSIDYTGALPTNDCIDTDANIHVDAMELFSDDVDQDCDGGDDSAKFSRHNYEWVNPKNVIIGTTDNDFSLVTAADNFNEPFTQGLENAGLFIRLDKSNPDNPIEYKRWQSGMLDNTIDAVFSNDHVYMGGSTSIPNVTVYVASWNTDTDIESVSAYIDESGDNISDFDLDLSDDGSVWAVATRTSGTAIMHATPSISGWAAEVIDYTSNILNNGSNGYHGIIEAPVSGDTVDVSLCLSGSICRTNAVTLNDDDGITIGASPSSTPYSPPNAGTLTHRNGLVLVTNPSTGGSIFVDGIEQYTLPSYEFVSADAVLFDDELYFIGVSSNGDLVTQFGSDPAVTYTATDENDLDIDVHSASITVTEENLAIAISGVDEDDIDVVGWAFFGWGA
jgi:hypothetical protein